MIHSAATLKSVLTIEANEAGPAIAKDPSSAGRIANGLAKRQGMLDAMTQWEADLANIDALAAKERWSELRIVATKTRVLAQMALRNNDDTWSGRGNDERRSYADGRREILSDVFNWMAHEYGEAVQSDRDVLA
jgi:hypothetical protein